MVEKESLDRIIHNNLLQLVNKRGIIIDGYPRMMKQMKDFQEKVSIWNCVWWRIITTHKIYVLQYNQNPPIILLDCSKLQLGRGRLDDSVSSFRRRLEIFREITLPMLKSLDADGRLTIVSWRIFLQRLHVEWYQFFIFSSAPPVWPFLKVSFKHKCWIFTELLIRFRSMVTRTAVRFRKSLNRKCASMLRTWEEMIFGRTVTSSEMETLDRFLIRTVAEPKIIVGNTAESTLKT